MATALGQEGTRRPARPFIVQVAALRKAIGTSRHEHRDGIINGLAAVGVVVPDGSVTDVDLELTSDPGGITAQGVVKAPWTSECRRCGGPVSGMVEADVRERFAPTTGRYADEDAYPLTGDEIDLEPLARDAVLLGLPLAPLCREECRGLCPVCGTDLNESPCTCQPAGDPRWSALDALRDPPA
jgi:uncharacterized protein